MTTELIQWQYKLYGIDWASSLVIEKWLNEMSAKGWNNYHVDSLEGTKKVFYFKRPIIQSLAKQEP